MNKQFRLTDIQSKRFQILKALFALFVVLNHSNSSNVNFQSGILSLNEAEWLSTLKYTLSGIIALCCNYGFFLMSSILLYSKDFSWKDNMKKKVKSLLIPYLTMNTLWIVIFGVCQSIPKLAVYFGNSINDVSSYDLLGWLGAYGLTRKYPFLAPMWFLKYLLVLNVFSLVIKNVIDKFPKLSLIVVIFLFLFIPSIASPFFDIEYLCVWCFGYYIVKYSLDIDYFIKKKTINAIYPILVVLYIFIFKGYINNGIICNVIERLEFIFGVIFWYSIFSSNIDGPIQKFLLKYSYLNFAIYLFHQYALDFIKKICFKIIPISNATLLLEYFVLPIIVIVIVAVVANLLNKYLPKTFAFVTGGRLNKKY